MLIVKALLLLHSQSFSVRHYNTGTEERRIFVKKFWMMIVAMFLMVSLVSVPALASCRNSGIETTMVIADYGWDYNVKVNARENASIESDVVTVLDGGKLVDIIQFDYDPTDGRTWAQVRLSSSGNQPWVSMKYLQPIEDGGTFFYLGMDVEVLDRPYDDADPFTAFEEDQLIFVEEIVDNGEFGFWAKVSADGRYGYIQLVLLDAV